MPQWPRMARASSGACGGRLLRVVATLAGGHATDLALGFDDGHAAQGRPLGTVGQPVEFADAQAAAGFDPAVIFFHRLLPAGLRQIFRMIQGVIAEALDLPVEHLMVGFAGEHVVGVGLADFPRDGLLAAHGVEGDDAAGQFPAAQQFGHGGAFVALFRGAELAEHQPVARRPGADQMHGATARAAAAAQGLAVEGDDFAGQRLAQPLGPGREGLRKLRGIQRREDPPESVVAGDALGQPEQAAQPCALRFAELLHLREALRAAKQRAEGEDQDVAERMAFGALHPRVGELGEVFDEAAGVGHPKLLPTPLLKVHL